MTLFVSSLAVFAVFLDTTVLFVAFPNITASFPDVAPQQLSWVLNGYTIVFAALLIPMGKLADRRGHKSMFLIGSVVFTLSSLLCAVAPGPWSLVAARVLQAAGGATLVPSSLALVLRGTPRHRVPVALAIWGATGAVAGAAGPTLGAALVEAGGWREGASATRDEPVARFARRSLRKRAAKVLAGLGCTPTGKPGRRDALAEPIGKGAARRALAALSIEARHDLRIAVKKLRYATEFFAGIFVGGEAGDLSAKAAGARHEATLDALEALQEDLGALNDLAVGDRLAASFPEPDPLLAEGLARLARPDAEDAAAEHLAAAAKAVKRLASAKPFWA